MVRKTSSNLDIGANPKTVQEATSGRTLETATKSNVKRTRLLQSDVPYYSLDEALRIPRAIADNYAYRPTRPLDVAVAMGVQPTSGPFRALAGTAIAYGLTDGGPNAPFISVTPLARKILLPQEVGEDNQARRQALLMPRVPREFLTKYDGHKLPPDEKIAKNVLLTMGVPKEALDRTLKLIIDSARSVGFLREIKGSTYVDLQSTTTALDNQTYLADVETDDLDSDVLVPVEPEPFLTQRTATITAPQPQRVDNRRVFITHGKNKSFIEPLKELLVYGELEPVVSVEHESVSQTIPDKVMSDMRSCSAAIIHIEDEQKLIDKEGEPHMVLNPNVLIEIGAAIALYGRKFILLVKSGVELPSNLQGLYEVRYDGDKLDYEATIRLLKALKDIKNQPSPTASV